eukprot:TRINITY_DN16755_c0_g2_i1.p1 TRINITY_DN16755_c0_g2~~TRINITY_DN16755_c0_g2_i1.p1  ORF type:complete len:103 (-),score=21.13 TRINITY_DN16755_c0_g2_i1:245-553(-)
MSSLSTEVKKLRLEQVQLQVDEEKLKKIIAKVKDQINAVKVEELELKNRQPLSDDYLRDLVSGVAPLPPANSSQEVITGGGSDILQQMVLGKFEVPITEDNN